MEISKCLCILISSIIISGTQQQALFTEEQEQQRKDDKLQRKISDQLGPLVDQYATNAFNNAMLEFRQKFLTEMDQLSDEIENLIGQAAHVEEAMQNMTRRAGRLGCPDVTDGYYYQFENNCFLFNNEKKTWSEAKEWCVFRSGHLARPKTSAINEYLKEQCRVTGKQYWIGGHDMDWEGDWVWDDGVPIPDSVTDWAPGEPNNYGSGQDCLGIGQDSEKKWDDKKCSYKLEFVCQTAAVFLLR